MMRFNEVSRSIATQLGAALVDLESVVPKTTKFLIDDVRYTSAGSELIAEVFAQQIHSSGIIERQIVNRGNAR